MFIVDQVRQRMFNVSNIELLYIGRPGSKENYIVCARMHGGKDASYILGSYETWEECVAEFENLIGALSLPERYPVYKISKGVADGDEQREGD